MGKIAFVFAGQGAQYVGMGKELYERFDTARALFDMLGERLDLVFNGSAEELNITVNTQPCLYVTDLACARILEEHGVKADMVAGFSLGEIPALAFAGIMSDKDGFDFVKYRAEVMQVCAEEHKGAMFAVLRLTADAVEEVCTQIPHAYPVNYNCPGQTVVACLEETADALSSEVAKKGGRAMRLAVSGAFHSPFMTQASEKIESYLADKSFCDMRVPVYANVTGLVYEDPRELISKQVKSPVLWQKTVEQMIKDGADTFIEVGAGKTLSGLIKKIDGGVRVFNVFDIESLENTLSEVQHA